MNTRKLRRVVIKEEFVELTGCHIQALVLNQLVYWTERAKDFDQFIAEEKARNPKITMPLTHGWIYKKLEDLNAELMLKTSAKTLGRAIASLIDSGVVEKRSNPDNRWDRTAQYRVSFLKLNSLLTDIGYSLQGYVFESGQDDPSLSQDDSTKGDYVSSTGQDDATYIRNTEITTEITTEIFPPLSPKDEPQPTEREKEILNFESRFTNPKKEPWKVGSGINDFDNGFVRWLSAQWKQDTQANAKAFLRKASRNEDKYLDALGYWEDYSSENAQRNGSEIDQRLKDLRAYYNIPTFFKTEARAAEEMSLEEKKRLLKACEERFHAA